MKKEMWSQAFALKKIPRTGWIRKGLHRPESVAAHSWGLALICLEFAPRDPPLSVEKVLKIALTHDIPEALVGDITPHDGMTKEEKHHLEKTAALKLLEAEMYAYWNEYEEHTTAESIFVHAMDKMDMALQASIYQESIETSEFIESAWKKIPEQYRWIWYELGIQTPQN